MSEWIECNGDSEIPDGLVDVKFSGGQIYTKKNLEDWGADGLCDGDIVAYRKCEPEPTAQSKLASLKRYYLDEYDLRHWDSSVEADETEQYVCYADVKALIEELERKV